MTCSRVVIINKGRVVAEDTPEALTHRLKGSAGTRLEARGDQGDLFDALRKVPGVRSLKPRAGEKGASIFEIDAEAGLDIRAELSRAVVQGGFELLGLEQVGMSLEEIFLHLTTTDVAEDTLPERPTEVSA